MNKIAVIYDELNELKMRNIHSSLTYHNENIDLSKDIHSYYNVIVTDKIFDYDKNTVLVISDYNMYIDSNYEYKNIIMIQYESEEIKKSIEEKYPKIKEIKNEVINAIPEQKYTIHPLNSQTSTIFYQGKDKPEDMVDSMFDLDQEINFEIMFYKDDIDFEPSKIHKLSWCVTKNKNLIGIISYKIIKEIENGCLPILIKEYMPKSFFAYPFYVTIDDLKTKKKLIDRVKEIILFLSKINDDNYETLINSIYKGIYVQSKWKLKYYLISEEINRYTY